VVLTGTVTGTAPSGQPAINTPAGVLSLDTRAPLPQGSTVTIEITAEPIPPRAAPLIQPSPFSREGLAFSRQWPDLVEAVTAVYEANPATAQSFLNTTVAQPNSQLAANLLFFLAALRGGDIRGWLGEGVSRTLQSIRPELLARMGEDFGRLNRLADEPASGEWRSVIFPFLNGAEIEQIRFFMRNRKGDKRKGTKGNADTRFVVDVELSRLGRLQLDGLIGKENKRLDLIVRTSKPLPSEIHHGIRNILTEASAITGMTGGLSFQAAPPNFIEIAPSAEQAGLMV